jgi:hypothetical protein
MKPKRGKDGAEVAAADLGSPADPNQYRRQGHGDTRQWSSSTEGRRVQLDATKGSGGMNEEVFRYLSERDLTQQAV